MSKKFPAANTATPVSIKDAGYRFAMAGESLESLVRFVMDKHPTFTTEVPSELRAELYLGFQLRKHEHVGDKFYKVTEAGHYLPVPEGTEGATVLHVNYAMSFTSNEFGKLREAEPAKHALIKELRDAVSTYSSNKLADMVRMAKRLAANGTVRKRAVNKDIVQAMKDAFEGMDKRVRTAQTRGEADADPVKFRTARDAFWKAYNG